MQMHEFFVFNLLIYIKDKLMNSILFYVKIHCVLTLKKIFGVMFDMMYHTCGGSNALHNIYVVSEVMSAKYTREHLNTI